MLKWVVDIVRKPGVDKVGQHQMSRRRIAPGLGLIEAVDLGNE